MLIFFGPQGPFASRFEFGPRTSSVYVIYRVLNLFCFKLIVRANFLYLKYFVLKMLFGVMSCLNVEKCYVLYFKYSVFNCVSLLNVVSYLIMSFRCRVCV